MDYSSNNYKHKRGSVYTTTDGCKYTQVKSIQNVIYLRCVLLRNLNCCKGTAKLNRISNFDRIQTYSQSHNFTS